MAYLIEKDFALMVNTKFFLILEINDKILNSNICALFDLVCYSKQSNVKIKTNLT